MIFFSKQRKDSILSAVFFIPLALATIFLCGCDYLGKPSESEIINCATMDSTEPNPLLQFATAPECPTSNVCMIAYSEPTETEMRLILGKPDGQAAISNRTMLLYGGEWVEFIDGKLINPKPTVIKQVDAYRRSQAKQADASVHAKTASNRQVGVRTKKTVLTQKEFLERFEQWQKDLFLADYTKNAPQNSTLNTQAQAFLAQYAECAGTHGSQETWRTAKNMGQKLIDAGCSDALVLYAYGSTVYITDGPTPAAPLVRKGLQLLESSKYSAYYRFLAARRLQTILYDLHENYPEIQELGRLKWKYLSLAAADRAFSAGNQRYYMTVLAKEWEVNTCDKLPDGAEEFIKKLNKVKDADPWIRLVVNGQYHMNKAWQARGGDWGHAVTEKGWAGFEKELSLARKCLTEAHSLHPEFPEAAMLMIPVSMGSGEKNEPRVWFNRSASAQFDYHPAYQAIFWALRPRWGGSHEEMYKLGLECLNTKRFDTEVPRYLLNALWDIGSELEEWRGAYRQPGVYENLQIFFDGVLHEPTRLSEKNYWLSVYAVASWAAGRYQNAKDIFSEIENHVDASVFPNWGVDAERVFGDISLETGAFRDEFAQAERLFNENQSIEALPLFESLSSNLKTNPSALSVIQDRLAVLKARANFLKGEWFNLIPDRQLFGWERKGGIWTVEPDGTLKGVSQQTDDQVMILNKCLMDRDYEFRGEVEANFRVSLIVEYTKKTRPDFVGVMMDKYTGQASMYRAPDSHGGIKSSVKLGPKNRFLIRVSKGIITVYINDERVFEEPVSACRQPQGSFIGLLANYYRCSGYEIRFKNLELRSLK